jgi:hypothetical protein
MRLTSDEAISCKFKATATEARLRIESDSVSRPPMTKAGCRLTPPFGAVVSEPIGRYKKPCFRPGDEKQAESKQWMLASDYHLREQKFQKWPHQL